MITWFKYIREKFTAVSSVTESDTFWTVFTATYQSRKAIGVIRTVTFVLATSLLGCAATIPVAPELIPRLWITFPVSTNGTFTFT